MALNLKPEDQLSKLGEKSFGDIKKITNNIFEGIDLDETLAKGIDLYKKLSDEGKEVFKSRVNNLNTDGIFDIRGVDFNALTYYKKLLEAMENVDKGEMEIKQVIGETAGKADKIL